MNSVKMKNRKCKIYRGMIKKDKYSKRWEVEGVGGDFSTKKIATQEAKKFVKECC